MAAANWRTLKKLDAHIHILPDAVHTANPDADDVWIYADLRQYVQIMRENHIERAVIMPFNDPFLMSMEFTADAVHRNLAEMKRRYPGRFYAFADIDVRNSRAETVDALCRAIDDHALDGIKFHPNNSGLALDSDHNFAIFTDGGFNRFLAGCVRLIGGAVGSKLVMLSGIGCRVLVNGEIFHYRASISFLWGFSGAP